MSYRQKILFDKQANLESEMKGISYFEFVVLNTDDKFTVWIETLKLKLDRS